MTNKDADYQLFSLMKDAQSHGKIEILHCKWCGQALDWGGSDKT